MDTLDEQEKAAKEFEKQQRERRVVELFEVGLDDEENTAGYHGMSLETLQFLIEQGHIPGHSRGEVTQFTEPGDLFFVAIPDRFPNFDTLTPSPRYTSPEKHAAGYASDLAQEHYILTQLGLPLDKPDLDEAALEVLEGSPHNEFFDLLVKESGKTRSEVKKIVVAAQKRKGVVIALGKSLFTPDKLVRLGDDIGDLRIQLPHGLSLNDIVGIDPQGKEELKFLEKLQTKYS